MAPVQMSAAWPERPMDEGRTTTVWVFSAEGEAYPCGVFSTQAAMEAFVHKHGLAGIGAEYPLDAGTYDSAVASGTFVPSRPHHGTARHVGRFSPPRHFHYFGGRRGVPPDQ